jgi:Tfp pilus assembly PilM family ATPase
MAKLLSPFSKSRSNRFLAIDFSPALMEIVYMEKVGDGFNLLAYDCRQLTTDSKQSYEEIVGQINHFIEQHHVVSREVVISISDADSVAIKYMTLPVMSPEELVRTAKWQIKEDVGFDVSDACTGFQIINTFEGDDGSKRNHLIFVVIKKEAADFYLAVVAQCGLLPLNITTSPFNYASILKKFPVSPSVTAILDIDYKEATLSIYAGTDLYFVRSLPITWEKITQSLTEILVSERGEVQLSEEEAEGVKNTVGIPLESTPSKQGRMESTLIRSLMRPLLEALVRELKFSFSYFVTTFDRDQPGILYITGGGANLRNLDTYLARELNMKVSCLPFPPNIHIKMEKPSEKISQDKKEKNGHQPLWKKPQSKQKGGRWPLWSSRPSKDKDQHPVSLQGQQSVASSSSPSISPDIPLHDTSLSIAKDKTLPAFKKKDQNPLHFAKEESPDKQIGYLKKNAPQQTSSPHHRHRRRKGNKIINADGALPVLDHEDKAKKELKEIVGSQEGSQPSLPAEVPFQMPTTPNDELETPISPKTPLIPEIPEPLEIHEDPSQINDADSLDNTPTSQESPVDSQPAPRAEELSHEAGWKAFEELSKDIIEQTTTIQEVVSDTGHVSSAEISASKETDQSQTEPSLKSDNEGDHGSDLEREDIKGNPPEVELVDNASPEPQSSLEVCPADLPITENADQTQQSEVIREAGQDESVAGQKEPAADNKGNKELIPVIIQTDSPMSEVFEKAARGEMSREVANMLTNAVGAGMADIHGINLLPAEIRAQKREQVQKISLRLVGFAIMMILIALIFLTRFQEEDYKNRIKNAKLELELVKTIEMWNEKIIQKEKLVRMIEQGRISVRDVLLMISMQVPPDVILDQLTLDPLKGSLVIQGVITAKEKEVEEVLTDFMEALENSPMVDDASLISSKRMGGVQRFDISCQLSETSQEDPDG